MEHEKEGTTERVTYLVVVGEDHKDSVIGSFRTLEAAQSALATYRDSHRGTYSHPAPLSWIEQSVRTLTLVPARS